MDAEKQKLYELAYFIAPLEKEEAVFIAAEKIKNLMTGYKAEIQKEELKHEIAMAIAEYKKSLS